MPDAENVYTPRCSCLRVDHVLLPPQSGCGVHGPPRPRETPKPLGVKRSDAQVEMVCAWSDYRKDYGVSSDDMNAAHKAFMAGWKAAREGDQSGPLR